MKLNAFPSEHFLLGRPGLLKPRGLFLRRKKQDLKKGLGVVYKAVSLVYIC
jgi:hypothetical protein